MTFRPKNNTKKEYVLSITAGICAICLFILSGVVQNFKALYQISALLVAVFGVEVYVKYIANDYIYEATKKDLKVYKVTGKKSICIACLDYEMSLSDVVHVNEFEENKGSFPTAVTIVNYCKNISPKDYYVYFFKFNGKNTMLKFEPDKIFADYTNEAINEALSNSQDDEY